MNEDREVLLFEVVFDAKGADEKAAQLRTNIERLKAARSELSAEFKKGDVSAEEFGKSMQAINKQLDAAQTELKGQTKAIADNDRAQKAAAGSVEQLRAKVILMNTAWDRLSKAERDNTQAGRALKAEIVATTSELKELEAATLRHQRNGTKCH